MKLVVDNHYHIWTDALHARQLARQTESRWDRGTYVRLTIITAWIALEMACQEALGDNSISRRFRVNLDNAIADKGYTEIDWGSGVWQKVKQIQNSRIDIVHRFESEDDLFPDVQLAEDAVAAVREAISDIFQRCSKPEPSWTKDDFDDGWKTGVSSISSTGYNSSYENEPDSIKLTYIYKDVEYGWKTFPPETAPEPEIEKMIENIRKPISAIRVYKNRALIQEIPFLSGKIRGG